VRGAVRQRVGLARAGTSQNEQRTRIHAFVRGRRSECRRAALSGIQRIECIRFSF
jgi:uncharacterized protein YjhX (UPF0386 family)